jgi:hypothetical protein
LRLLAPKGSVELWWWNDRRSSNFKYIWAWKCVTHRAAVRRCCASSQNEPWAELFQCYLRLQNSGVGWFADQPLEDFL